MINLLRSWRHRRRLQRLASETPEQVFSRYYRDNTWGDKESASGKGSNLFVTEALRAALPGLLSDLGVKRMLDVPCGDFHWMSRVELGAVDYIGGDIVADMIAENRTRYGGPGRHFEVINLITDALPETDLVFTRDCLVHLSFADAAAAVENIRKSGATYLMATTFPQTERNENILTGQWRRLDMRKPPFDFPAPLLLVDERFQSKDGRHTDKSMGIWRVSDLPIARPGA